jgi:outer membrane receptor for ferrienterochelin and colicin
VAEAILAEGLELDFGGAFMNAKLTADQPDVDINPSLGSDGDRLPNVPKVQFNAGLTYRFAVGADAHLALKADVNHRGSTNTQFNSSTANTIPLGFNVPLDAYTLTNLRANLDWSDWTFSVFAKNVFDKRAQIDAIASSQDPLARITVRPRTIGVAMTRTF